MDDFFKYKYIKYKHKYIQYKSFLQIGGNKDNNITKISTPTITSFPSIYNKMVHIKKSNGPNDPAYMKFGDDKNIFQSMYDINDIDKIYLYYINAIITFTQYIYPHKILILGLGGGHIPMLIRKNFPDCHMDIVELDPVVLHAAKEIGFRPDNKMNIYITDGIFYCNTTTEKNYDCIIIDFDSKHSKKFNFRNVNDILNNDGILIINGFNSDSELFKNISKYFPCIKIYNYLNWNYIYLCSKSNNCDKIKQNLNNENASIALKKFKYFNDIIKTINNMESFIIIKGK